MPYCTFGIGLIFWSPDSGRYDGSTVVFCHSAIDFVDSWIMVAITFTDYRSLAVVRYKYLSHTTKVLIHIDVCRYPGSLLFIRERFSIRILAVTHYTDKDRYFSHFTGVRID